ncbi:MAG: hypothetical protein ACQEST_11655 [Bacteroidota bacterium]
MPLPVIIMLMGEDGVDGQDGEGENPLIFIKSGLIVNSFRKHLEMD